ncbi:MAG: hypothetical protein AAGA22_07175 [Pseudomonadota bacterium]
MASLDLSVTGYRGERRSADKTPSGSNAPANVTSYPLGFSVSDDGAPWVAGVVVNTSAEGVAIACRTPPPVGAAVIIALGDRIEFAGRVRKHFEGGYVASLEYPVSTCGVSDLAVEAMFNDLESKALQPGEQISTRWRGSAARRRVDSHAYRFVARGP